jgi:hypothetical protein
MVAPSAEQVVKMLQTAKMIVSGARVDQTASAGRDHAQTRTTVTPGPDSGRGSDFDAAPRSRRRD